MKTYATRVIMLASLIVACFIGAADIASGQQLAAGGQDEPITDTRKAEIIDSVSALVNRAYVFPDVAKKMEAAARKKLKAGGYTEFKTTVPFLMALHNDLREVCKDGHFGVRFDPNPRPAGDSVTPEMEKEYLEEQRRTNYGFEKVEILDGNIGYVKFNNFIETDIAQQTAISVMGFLANTDALIIDLRENGGGDPSMIQLISSYFFEKSVHLNSFEERGNDTLKQFWTSLGVVGKKMTNIPIYVLTSHYTFSAAEEFSYNLKNLKRATIVGETTGGGAHPVNEYAFPNLKVSMRVPYARAINPITGTNWEGVGVKPDIDVPADQALVAAQTDAFKKLQESTPREDLKRQYAWLAARVEAEANPPKLTEAELAACAGTYGPRAITFENGALFSQRQGGPKLPLIAMTRDLFRFGGGSGDYLRLRFQRDSSGAVTGVLAIFSNGLEESFAKQSAN